MAAPCTEATCPRNQKFFDSFEIAFPRSWNYIALIINRPFNATDEQADRRTEVRK
jgi:hypothetical protein